MVANLLKDGQGIAGVLVGCDGARCVHVNDSRLARAVAIDACGPQRNRHCCCQVPEKSRVATGRGRGSHGAQLASISILEAAFLIRGRCKHRIHEDSRIACGCAGAAQRRKRRWITIAIGNPVGDGRGRDRPDIRHRRCLICGLPGAQQVGYSDRGDDEDDRDHDQQFDERKAPGSPELLSVGLPCRRSHGFVLQDQVP
jgi:hypothetical protein